MIRLEVPHERRLRPEAGVVLTRLRGFARRVLVVREPPIVRMKVAVLTAAAHRPRLDAAVTLVLDACRQRRTTPHRLLTELDAMPRLPRRKLFREVLRDATSGVESFLELTYPVTLRFGYQLVADPCSAAAQVAAVLRARGWPGHPNPCAPACTVGVDLGSAVYLK